MSAKKRSRKDRGAEPSLRIEVLGDTQKERATRAITISMPHPDSKGRIVITPSADGKGLQVLSEFDGMMMISPEVSNVITVYEGEFPL
jgi:hypothetical protein